MIHTWFVLLLSLFFSVHPGSGIQLDGTQWRLVQCYYDNKLRAVNHRVEIQFSDDMKSLSGNDGCSDFSCDLYVAGNNLSLTELKYSGHNKCLNAQKTKVSRVFTNTLKAMPLFLIKGDYMTMYRDGAPTLVLSKINTFDEDVTIIKRSYRIEPVLYKKKGIKYMKLYDYATESFIYLEKIEGFTFKRGSYYNIEMKTTVTGTGDDATYAYELIRIVSEDPVIR
ncbi:MAG: META domain-containing protein [Saprospiraceae bacterium]|nr:META domain-containing protein [Saprospiraceae bacterium]